MSLLTGVYSINQSQLLDLYEFAIKSGTNLLVLGPAGMGKTEMAEQVIEKLECKNVYIDMSVLEGPDFVGLQVLAADRLSVHHAAPNFMPLAVRKKEGSKPNVMLFDEADKARQELQYPLLEVLQHRSINGEPLDVQGCILTGNLPDENAGSMPMNHALTNRCLVYKVDPDFECWRGWAVRNNVNALVVQFLEKHQGHFTRQMSDATAQDPTAYAYDSPRAWTNTARDLDTAGLKVSLEFQTILVAGRVGTGSAAEFRVWLEFYREIEPFISKLVRTGEAPPDMSIDRLIVAAISSMAEVVNETKRLRKEKKKFDDQFKKVATNVFAWLKTIPSEFQIAAMKNTLDMEVVKEFDVTRIPHFMDCVEKTRAALKAK